jgi:phage FluMu protein Com
MSDRKMTISKQWIEAAGKLAKDATARVNCPRCKKAFLSVWDADLDEDHFERQPKCPRCHERGAILLSKKLH